MGPRFLAGCFRSFTTKLATTLEWKPIDAVADIITQLTEELSFIKLLLFLRSLQCDLFIDLEIVAPGILLDCFKLTVNA